MFVVPSFGQQTEMLVFVVVRIRYTETSGIRSIRPRLRAAVRGRARPVVLSYERTNTILTVEHASGVCRRVSICVQVDSSRSDTCHCSIDFDRLIAKQNRDLTIQIDFIKTLKTSCRIGRFSMLLGQIGCR